MTTSPGGRRTKDAEALDMAVAGVGWQDIGRRLGIASTARVRTTVERALGRGSGPSDDVPQELQLRRLDELQARWWDRACSGELEAAQLVMRIVEHRSAILGLCPDRTTMDDPT